MNILKLVLNKNITLMVTQSIDTLATNLYLEAGAIIN